MRWCSTFSMAQQQLRTDSVMGPQCCVHSKLGHCLLWYLRQATEERALQRFASCPALIRVPM